jgi:hypothetical protein
MSLQEINVHAGRKILMEFDYNNALIVGDLHGILGQQLRPHTIHLLNTTLIINYLSNPFKKHETKCCYRILSSIVRTFLH